MESLEVARLPKVALYGPEGDQQNMAAIVHELRATVEDWARMNLVKLNASFGFAMANPNPALPNPDVDPDPYQFVWFTAGWGPKRDRYVANAVRKLRAVLRTGRDTLDLRINAPYLFTNHVESEVNGTFPWGDFPWGGGTLVQMGGLVLPCAVSALKEVEDDAVAKAIGGNVGATMLKLRDPATFA